MPDKEECTLAAAKNGWIIKGTHGNVVYRRGDVILVCRFDGEGRMTAAQTGLRPVFTKRLDKILAEMRR